MNTSKQFLTKLIVIGFLFSICSISVYAQKGKQSSIDESIVTEDRVPAEVLKSYKKRFASASDAVWRFNKFESSYSVKMTSRGIPMEAIFDSEGDWMGTIEQWDVSKLSSSFKKTVDQFYQDYKVHSMSKHVMKDKDDMVIVQIYEKQNSKNKLLTTIYMDKNGRFITADEPNVDDVDGTEKMSKKQLKEEEQMRKEFDKDRQLDIYPTKLEESELPDGIQRWVRINYPEYIYKSIDFKEYPELKKYGSVYQIVIQRSGINQPYATAWFTRDGDLLKMEDTFNDKYENVTAVAEKKIAKVKREIPENVVDSFNVKFPSAKSVRWEENEDGDWDFSFTDRYGENVATYTDVSGQWLQTKIFVPEPTKVPSAIRNAIARDYPKAEVVQGWLIKSLGQKNYYIVEIYTKKTKETELLEYWQTGKPRD
jgi:hypothetical protein